MAVAARHTLAAGIDEAKQAPSLGFWFDAGLLYAPADTEDDVPHVRGARSLPKGYVGCNKGQLLINTSGSFDITIWPVRFDLGELSVDGIQPWTLYHFTHEASFEQFTRIFAKLSDVPAEGQVQDAVGYHVTMHDVRVQFFRQLQADFQERQPTASTANPKGEPELIPVEPVKFTSKQDILYTMFGKEPQGLSKLGHKLNTFAEYCLAFRVPASACHTVAGPAGKYSVVRLSKDTLDTLHRRVENRKLVARQRQEREEQARAERERMAKKKKNGCASFFACGGNTGSRRSLGAAFTSDEEDDEDGDGGGNRKNKRLEPARERMVIDFLKSHFDSQLQHQAAQEEKRRRSAEYHEEQRQLELQRQQRKRNRLKGGRVMKVDVKMKTVDADDGMPSFSIGLPSSWQAKRDKVEHAVVDNLTKGLTMMGMEDAVPEVLEGAGLRNFQTKEEMRANQMFKDFMRKQELDKDTIPPPKPDLKIPRTRRI